MMQVESGGKGKKGERRKMDTRVDFTPMVDMIMLLLTFFMLATTLSKPQTMEIAMPAKDKPADPTQGDVAKASEAITIYLGGDNSIYYFEGIPEPQTPNFLKSTNYSAEGLRQILVNKNRAAVAQVNELKDKKLRLQVTQEEYDQQLRELKGGKGTPVVIIKPLDNSNYDNLVSALDEMLIASVGKYAIADLDETDKTMLKNSNVNFEAQ